MPEILNFEKYECEVTFHFIHTARVTRCLSEGVRDTDIGVMSKSLMQIIISVLCCEEINLCPLFMFTVE